MRQPGESANEGRSSYFAVVLVLALLVALLEQVPTALDNGRRSPRKLLRAVVARLLGGKPWSLVQTAIHTPSAVRAVA